MEINYCIDNLNIQGLRVLAPAGSKCPSCPICSHKRFLYGSVSSADVTLPSTTTTIQKLESIKNYNYESVAGSQSKMGPHS